MGGLDSSPAQPLWLFAGMTNFGGFKKVPDYQTQALARLSSYFPPADRASA